MSNPLGNLNILRQWKPGDTRELPGLVLKKARLEGRFDSYSQIYDLDGRRWKIREQVSKPTGETLYTLVCVNE